MNNQENVTNNEQLNTFGMNPTANTNVNNVNTFPQAQNANNNIVINNQNINEPIINNQQIVSNNQNMNFGTTNNNVIPNNQVNGMNTSPTQNAYDDRLINPNTTSDGANINDLNVNGAYNKMEAPEYVNDSKVTENIHKGTKKTIPITKELKTVILIALVLLAFIIFMPIISDLIYNFRFH